jgi:tRNA dimethylallyltransferase
VVAARLIAVVGPTASGKSRLALALAERHGGEIVSCDSLQVYRGLDIGSAKATAEERSRVAHHMLDLRDPDASFSAADYGRLAREAVAGVTARRRVPIVAGGTGLYLRALLGGLFEGPARDEALRARFEGMAQRFGDARLHRLLSRIDPTSAARIARRDRRRVVRALEVYWKTGRPLSAHHDEAPPALEGFEVLVVGLAPDRESLRRRIEDRTERMFSRGLLEEVRNLLARYPPSLAPLQAIGYRQAVAVVVRGMGLDEARHDIVAATMRYAKRQMTWFRHQAAPRWFADAEHAEAAVGTWLMGSG